MGLVVGNTAACLRVVEARHHRDTHSRLAQFMEEGRTGYLHGPHFDNSPPSWGSIRTCARQLGVAVLPTFFPILFIYYYFPLPLCQENRMGERRLVALFINSTKASVTPALPAPRSSLRVVTHSEFLWHSSVTRLALRPASPPPSVPPSITPRASMAQVHPTQQSEANSTCNTFRNSILVGLVDWNAEEKNGDEDGGDGGVESEESYREV
jgi:hypothetical protein